MHVVAAVKMGKCIRINIFAHSRIFAGSVDGAANSHITSRSRSTFTMVGANQQSRLNNDHTSTYARRRVIPSFAMRLVYVSMKQMTTLFAIATDKQLLENTWQ